MLKSISGAGLHVVVGSRRPRERAGTALVADGRRRRLPDLLEPIRAATSDSCETWEPMMSSHTGRHT